MKSPAQTTLSIALIFQDICSLKTETKEIFMRGWSRGVPVWLLRPPSSRRFNLQPPKYLFNWNLPDADGLFPSLNCSDQSLIGAEPWISIRASLIICLSTHHHPRKPTTPSAYTGVGRISSWLVLGHGWTMTFSTMNLILKYSRVKRAAVFPKVTAATWLKCCEAALKRAAH